MFIWNCSSITRDIFCSAFNVDVVDTIYTAKLSVYLGKVQRVQLKDKRAITNSKITQ